MNEKSVKKICKNCRLYNPQEGVCAVTVMHGGEYLELKVKPNDRCWWERMEQELATLDGEDTQIEIQQVCVKYDLDNKKMKIETPLFDNPYNS